MSVEFIRGVVLKGDVCVCACECVCVRSLLPEGTCMRGCICQCVTFSCVLMSASPRVAAGAVSFSLRSVQQQAVWLSGFVTQWQKKHQDLVPQITDLVDTYQWFTTFHSKDAL